MIVAFLAVLTALLSFQFFTVTLRINNINRIVVNTPIALFESSVPLIIPAGSDKPGFDKRLLERKIRRYYEKTLTKYSKSYQVYFNYYNQSNHSYCTALFCDAVQVKVKAVIVFQIPYQKTMFYEIKDMTHAS